MMRSSSRGDRRVERARRHRLAIEDAVEDDGGRRAGKTLPAGRHLVEHDAERKEIGARIEVLAARLLRRHVRDGADGRPRHARELLGGLRRRIDRACVSPARASRGRSRAPSPGRDAVRKMFAGLMSRCRMPSECAASSASAICVAEFEHACAGRAAWPASLRSSVLAFEQLHRQIAAARRARRSCRSCRCSGDSGSTRCAPRGGTVRSPPRSSARCLRQHLERDEPAEAHVLRLVDDAHPASAELSTIRYWPSVWPTVS